MLMIFGHEKSTSFAEIGRKKGAAKQPLAESAAREFCRTLIRSSTSKQKKCT